MSILGRGWGKDLALIFANSAISGVESPVGQNFFQPKIQGTVGGKVNEGFDMGAKISGAIAPMFMDAWIPGSGQAINAARGVAPELGDMRQQPQQPQVQPLGQPVDRQQAYAEGNSLYALGGQMPMPGAEGTGPNLYAFNGPSHAEGGMQFNQNAEIEKKETIDPSAKYVYSDQLKVPGTDKTFADMSKKWKGKDTDDDITKKTNTLMLARLRNNQEELKKIQFEKASQKFQKKYGDYLQEQMAKGGYYTPQEAQAAHPNGKWVNIGEQYGGGPYGDAVQYHYGGGYGHSHFNNQQLANNDMWATGNQAPLGANSLSLINSPIDLSGTSALTPQDPTYGVYQPNFNRVRMSPRGTGINLRESDMDIEATNPNSPFFKTTGFQQPEYKRTTYESADPQAEGTTPSDTPGKFNYNKFNEMGKYAPIAYNLAQSMQPIDYYKPVYNPQYDKAIELASNTRYDAAPELREARQTFNNMRGAIDQSNSLAGKLSNYQYAGIAADRAKQAVYSKKHNADNQYRLQEAQIRGNLGEQRAAEDRQTQLYKLQAETVPRNYLGTAATQYGQVSQVNTQMANQAKRDQILATAAKEQWPYDVLIKVLDQYKTA